jgi:hypothetical protein
MVLASYQSAFKACLKPSGRGEYEGPQFYGPAPGGPPVRGGGGMPQRIVISSRSPSALRTTGAG